VAVDMGSVALASVAVPSKGVRSGRRAVKVHADRKLAWLVAADEVIE
jgi:hypothetical protein